MLSAFALARFSTQLFPLALFFASSNQLLIFQGKNVEILHAVEDLIKIIRAHPLDDHLERVSEEEVTKLKKHYNHFMYQVRTKNGKISGSRYCLFFNVNVSRPRSSIQLIQGGGVGEILKNFPLSRRRGPIPFAETTT